MPQIKPAHRLYLYRLFKTQLGVGKQTSLTRASEVLETDGLAPRDVGCKDARELFEQLSDCVKLTVFKKGAIFVTVLAHEEYDRMLEKAAKGGEKSAAGGKSWKRKKGGKDVKPLKPKHIVEKKPEVKAAIAEEPATEATGESAVESAAQTGEAAAEKATDGGTGTGPETQSPVAKKTEGSSADAPGAANAGAQESAAPAETVAAAGQEVPRDVNEPQVDGPLDTDSKAPAAPEATHEPPIKFTITYTPEPKAADAEEPEATPEAATTGGAQAKVSTVVAQAKEVAAAKAAAPAAEPAQAPAAATVAEVAKADAVNEGAGMGAVAAPVPAFATIAEAAKAEVKPATPAAPASANAPSHEPEAANEDADESVEAAAAKAAAPAPATVPTRAKKPARAHDDLPRDFYADVRCPDEHLSALYQVLPLDVDPVATLEEDFRIARSTGALEGTRSSVSFPLRFRRRNGEPVVVTLRRSASAFAGKHWTLAGVEADSPEEVGFGALEHKGAGAWAAFATNEQLKGMMSPDDQLAQEVVLGSWEALLDELAALAAPEDWGEENALLREYLAMRWLRAKRQKRVSMADDGSSAAFDTGLLTAGGEPIGAILEPHDGDIIWELTCFSANAAAYPAAWPDMPSAATIADALLAQNDPELRRCAQRVARNPRVATQAYDPVAEAVYVLVPARGGALALDFTGNEPRVVSVADLADARACARAISSDQPAWLLP